MKRSRVQVSSSLPISIDNVNDDDRSHVQAVNDINDVKFTRYEQFPLVLQSYIITFIDVSTYLRLSRCSQWYQQLCQHPTSSPVSWCCDPMNALGMMRSHTSHSSHRDTNSVGDGHDENPCTAAVARLISHATGIRRLQLRMIDSPNFHQLFEWIPSAPPSSSIITSTTIDGDNADMDGHVKLKRSNSIPTLMRTPFARHITSLHCSPQAGIEFAPMLSAMTSLRQLRLNTWPLHAHGTDVLQHLSTLRQLQSIHVWHLSLSSVWYLSSSLTDISCGNVSDFPLGLKNLYQFKGLKRLWLEHDFSTSHRQHEHTSDAVMELLRTFRDTLTSLCIESSFTLMNDDHNDSTHNSDGKRHGSHHVISPSVLMPHMRELGIGYTTSPTTMGSLARMMPAINRLQLRMAGPTMVGYCIRLWNSISNNGTALAAIHTIATQVSTSTLEINGSGVATSCGGTGITRVTSKNPLGSTGPYKLAWLKHDPHMVPELMSCIKDDKLYLSTLSAHRLTRLSLCMWEGLAPFAAIASCTMLTSLSLVGWCPDGNGIRHIPLSRLPSLPYLCRFDLRGCALANDGLIPLPQLTPNVTWLNLSRNVRLTASTLQPLVSLTRLRWLNIQSTITHSSSSDDTWLKHHLACMMTLVNMMSLQTLWMDIMADLPSHHTTTVLDPLRARGCTIHLRPPC